MKTIFSSSQYNVNENQLANYFDGFIDGVEELKLYDITMLPSGHGHYHIGSEFHVDGEKVMVNTVTSNMELVDAWRSLMNDTFSDEEGAYYETEDELINSVLGALKPEDNINEHVFLKVERISKTTPIMETAFFKWLEAEKHEGRVYTDMHFAIRRYLDGRNVKCKTQQERHKQVYLFFKWVTKVTLDY